MSNFKNISPNLRTIDKENDNALASSGKKNNFLLSTNGIENRFKSVKQAGVKEIAFNKTFLLPAKNRERKTSNSVIYQLDYGQKIQGDVESLYINLFFEFIFKKYIIYCSGHYISTYFLST